MAEDKLGHLLRLPIDSIRESIYSIISQEHAKEIKTKDSDSVYSISCILRW